MHFFVERYLEEAMVTKPAHGSSRGGLPVSSSRWLPQSPPPGLAKINVDAAMAKAPDLSAQLQ
jgi:hypothetical protein